MYKVTLVPCRLWHIFVYTAYLHAGLAIGIPVITDKITVIVKAPTVVFFTMLVIIANSLLKHVILPHPSCCEKPRDGSRRPYCWFCLFRALLLLMFSQHTPSTILSFSTPLLLQVR